MFPFKKKANAPCQAEAARILDLASTAVSFSNLGQHEDALSCIDEAFSLRPEMPRFFFLHLTRSAILIALGRFQDAILQCEDGLTVVGPEGSALQAGFLKNKGLALARLGRLTDALACYDRAARLEPNDPQLWLNRGGVLIALKSPLEALQSYQRGLEVEPENVQLVADIGNALYALARTQDAVNWYKRAISINPRDAILWHNLAVALRDLGSFQECLQCFDRALEISPDDARTWSAKAEVLRSIGMADEANGCFNRADELGAI